MSDVLVENYSEPLLELRDISCERDERLLFSHLNLTLRAGDILQLEGPNGSGKTTLLRLITQMSDSFDGQLRWRGRSISELKLQFLQDLLYIGHLPGIKKALTARENLTWYMGLEGQTISDKDQSIEQALAAVAMTGYEDVVCYQLSAGQQRRVSLARLFLSKAILWVLDEPFTAIDKRGVANLEARMQAHVAAGGAVILTTHQDMGIEGIRRLSLADFKPELDLAAI